MSSNGNTATRAKRRKVEIGKRTKEDDIPTAQSQSNLPTSTAWSTRTLPSEHIQPLSTLCIHVFAENLRKLSLQAGVWDSLKPWLIALPDTLVPRLFAALRTACPTILSHDAIATYLMRGPSITLTDDLTGVNKNTVSTIGLLPNRKTLRHLDIVGLTNITDDTLASVISKLPALEILNLRGCTKAGPKTVAAASNACPQLLSLNINYTSVNPASLAGLVKECESLEVLKLAGIPNWTDATVSKLWDSLPDPEFQLPNLKTLKLRQTSVTDVTINRFLAMCPNIRRLDVSFTLVQHPPLLLSSQLFEKLSLTSTRIANADLLHILSDIPNLKTLALGALGGGRGFTASISNSSAMTLTDQTLRQITDILDGYDMLEKVSLVGNSKLGMAGRSNSAIADFIRRVGRRCTSLNMASISSLRSSDLEGLVPDAAEDGSPHFQTLILNNTNVDDDAAPFISSCADLQTLELAGTKITRAGLFPIIDTCTRLEQLNLTSCRGVGVVDRRRFFEVWESEWKDK